MSIENLSGNNKEIAQEAFNRIREGIVSAALRGMEVVNDALDCFGEDEDE